jgi:signal recognition particle receptor subunit beta
MVLFNYATRELTAKVVYYGPGLCGKTTNLEFIHKNLPEKTRGKMLSLATQTDRTLFFDFLPIDLGSIKGMKTRVQLYTVPGQVFYDATRKLVLKGADGIVFVVDSQKEMLNSNLESWQNLKQNLAENNLDINNIPVVIQYNKRDLPNVLPVKQLNSKINDVKAEQFEAVAITGKGVQETLKGIAKLVLVNLAQRFLGDEKAFLEKPEGEEVQVPPTAAVMNAAQGSPVNAAIPEKVEPIQLQSMEEEEIHELPHPDMESEEDEAITLEPLSEIPGESESPTIDELEEVEELALHEIPEPIPPPVEKLNIPGGKSASVSKSASNIAARGGVEDIAKLVGVSPRKSGSFGSKKVEPPQVTVTASAGASPQEVSIPIDVTVGKEGQEIKLQLSINLKIKVKRD